MSVQKKKPNISAFSFGALHRPVVEQTTHPCYISVMELYAEASIFIQAPIEKVWQVLTDNSYTNQWVSSYQPAYKSLESEWKLHDRVEWKDAKGIAHVDGRVTQIDSPTKLHFSVHDMSGAYDDVQSDDDGITYYLSVEDKGTRLTVKHGDFGKVPSNGERLRNITLQSWESALASIKQLAEADNK